MEMTDKAIELVQKTAVNAATAQVLEIPGDGRKTWVQCQGAIQEIVVTPAVRSHEIGSLGDLAAYAVATRTGAPVVWHNPQSCVLVLDDADRRDVVTFALSYTEPWIMLRKLEDEKPAMEQREFIKLLRLVLDVEPGTVALFRKLDWKSTSQATGEIGRGKESLGKSIMGEVSGMSEIPDYIDIQVPIYRTLGETQEYILRCLLEFDTLNARIQLVPASGEMDRIEDLHQSSIADRLGKYFSEGAPERMIPVYYGRP